MGGFWCRQRGQPVAHVVRIDTTHTIKGLILDNCQYNQGDDSNSGAVLTPGTIGTFATVDDIRRCKALLEGTDVRPKDEKYYFMITHPYIVYDIN